jgi:hypothetical protein
MVNTLRVRWRSDRLCHSCFYTAMRTHGICPLCGHDGVLPGRANKTDDRPICLTCAGIPGHYRPEPDSKKANCTDAGNAPAAPCAII